MSELIILLFGVYFVMVGINGNAEKLLIKSKNDINGFGPWIFSILALGIISQIKPLKKPAFGLFGIALLVVILKKQTGIITQIKDIYNDFT